ncbi:hypothetical protein FRB99_002418, partial [Tulasnella sp. 403]
MRLSKSAAAVGHAPIETISQWAKEYNGSHGDLLDLCQGAPGNPPNEALTKSLAEVASHPSSAGYSPILGIPALRRTLAEEMKIVYGPEIDVGEEDIAITAGCNLAFYAVITALAEPGDEVILPDPWYFNHQMTLQLQGVRTVALPADPDNGFLPSSKICESLITPKTKAITLVTPNNPTGAVYPPSLLREFATVAQKHNVALIIDETYRDFIAPDSPHDLFSSFPWNWRDHFIHLFSFSKSYAIPGHRLGAVVASPTVIELVGKSLDCTQICAPSIIQLAVQPILHSLRPSVDEITADLASRRQTFITSLPFRWKVGSAGGYFVFVKHPFPNHTNLEVSERLVKELGVKTLPGSYPVPDTYEDNRDPFSRWLRISIAKVEQSQLAEA